MGVPSGTRLLIERATLSSCTDGRSVQVSTSHFDDPHITLEQKIDTFIGFALHEGCHVLYTDFEAGKGAGNALVHSLTNIIEDERIEHRLGEEMPGYAKSIAATKYYCFDKYRRDHRAELDAAPYAARLVNAIIGLVRFPAALTDGELTEFGDLLVQVREVLEEFAPKDTSDAIALAQRIYDIIKDAVKEESRKEGGKGSEGSKGEKGEEGEGGGTSEGSQSEGEGRKDSANGGKEDKEENAGDGDASEDKDKKSGDGKDASDEEDAESSGTSGKEDADGDAGKDEDEGSDSEDEDGSGDGEDASGLSEDELKDLLEGLAKMIDEECASGAFEDGGLSEDDICSAVRRNPNMPEIIYGTLERGEVKGVYVEKIKDADVDGPAAAAYEASLARVKRYIPAIRRILTANGTEYQFSEHGCRNGKLDAGKLAEAMQGSQTVYIRRGEVRSAKTAVAVLVDESGSMSGGSFAVDGRRLCKDDIARDTAVLIEEALKTVPNIELFIYGHTADEKEGGDCELRVYREKGFCGRRTLGTSHARSNNADGFAIEEVTRRIRRQTQAPVLLFVISDGAPAAYAYRSTDGVKHTREAVKKAAAQGFAPVQIAIESYFDPKTMFDHWVTFTDLAKLPLGLAKIVKKAVLKNAPRTVSYL